MDTDTEMDTDRDTDTDMDTDKHAQQSHSQPASQCTHFLHCSVLFLQSDQACGLLLDVPLQFDHVYVFLDTLPVSQRSRQLFTVFNNNNYFKYIYYTYIQVMAFTSSEKKVTSVCKLKKQNSGPLRFVSCACTHIHTYTHTHTHTHTHACTTHTHTHAKRN